MTFDIAARAFLRDHGAESIDHPGGTLYAHLCRVEERLATLGADEHVQLAGLTHATYGTDGFARALVDRTDRAALREIVGAEAEELVYLYAACDRDRTWPGLATSATVHDRFTGEEHVLSDGRLTPFVDLTIVNELDVFEQNAALLDQHRGYFRDLFARWAPVTSPNLAADIRRLMEPL